MDFEKFNKKFSFTVFEAEESKTDSAKDVDKDDEDAPKFPKKTKVDLTPEEQIEQHN